MNLRDLETYVKSSRLAWLGRIFSEGSSLILIYLLENLGEVFLFSCNYDVKDRELFQWWADSRIAFATKPSIYLII